MTAPHYTCTRCGACCRWPGEVHLTDAEVDAIAAFLGRNVADFTAAFTQLAHHRRGLVLTERADGACIMLDGDRVCRINPVKPQQCRDFPDRWSFPGFAAVCRATVAEAHEAHVAEAGGAAVAEAGGTVVAPAAGTAVAPAGEAVVAQARRAGRE